MVLPPKHVYSAIVKNLTSKAVQVRALYAMPDNSPDVETVLSINAGESATLEQKIVELSTFSATAHIRHVEVVGGAALTAPFDGVASPVKDYLLEISEQNGVVQLRGSV
ncbi:hypothetical protein ERJ75_000731000 [Trypanosoma vivax]|uniref:Uncharacterized protein n=1 Tax=Trypanosoma vivax (strain Y486) TaxID=1055687 RepID=G0TX68_TRYVY|nr:hypothetical protein TRVL_00642 [Trypanosoma vivax]KAH8614061.1 hypothetical protein ERJ75_000731000 [Trypanosoma vivax]CCC48558.1 conserved hypothetical protein [Trypanosoma vivax Y486]